MSTDTPQIRTEYDRTEQSYTITRVPCLCGCGEMPTRESADFVAGHDAKYKGNLIRAHLAGITITVRDGDEETEVTPLALAEQRHWAGALTDAKAKADAKKAAEAAKEAAKNQS